MKTDWENVAIKLLVGRKIVACRYMNVKESDELGWDGERAIVLVLDNGLLVYPSRDDEGNGAGAMFTSSDAVPTLPVLS